MTPLQWVGFILFLPFLVPFVLLLAFWYIGRAIVLHALLLACWAPRGRHVLFVYSNSPNWKEYCEREFLPHLPETAIVLNWSERKKWPRWTLSTQLYRAYAGSEEFNPLGIVFRPWKPTRLFAFWKPFRDAKHGRPEKLERLKAEFLEAASGQG